MSGGICQTPSTKMESKRTRIADELIKLYGFTSRSVFAVILPLPKEVGGFLHTVSREYYSRFLSEYD